MLACQCRVAGRRVDARADRRRTEVDLTDQRLRFAQALHVFLQRMREGHELLAEGHRHGILHLRAPHLDQWREVHALGAERIGQPRELGAEAREALVQRHAHRGGIHVVGGLAEIDVIVGRDHVIGATLLVGELERTVRDHFVGVHVGGGAGASLNHVHQKMLVMSPGAYFAGGTNDDLGVLLVEETELEVGLGGGFLDRGERFDEHREFTEWNTGDREILERPQRLHTVQRFIRHVALAEEIVLLPAAVAAEAERTASADEGGIGAAQAHRDRAGGAGHERGVQLRRLARDVVEQGAGQDHRGARHDHSRRGSVGGVVEQQPFAHRFAGTERHEARGAAIGRLLDRDRAADQNREALTRFAFVENGLVGDEGERRDVPRKLPEVRVGEALEERGGAQRIGDFGRSSHGGSKSGNVLL